MYLAPVRSVQSHQKRHDYENARSGWDEFLQDMTDFYRVDLGCLTPDFYKEQHEYFLETVQWVDLHPDQMLGPAACFKEYDLKYVTLEELKAPLEADFDMRMAANGPVESFLGFFDTAFKGSKENPVVTEVLLSTAPDATGATHWGQQCFHLHPKVSATAGDHIKGRIRVERKKENHRLMQVYMSWKLEGKSEYAQLQQTPRNVKWVIE